MSHALNNEFEVNKKNPVYFDLITESERKLMRREKENERVN